MGCLHLGVSANLQPDTEHRVWKRRGDKEEGAAEGERPSGYSSRQLDCRQHRGANPTAICGPSRSGTGEETSYAPGNHIGDANKAGAQQNYWFFGNPEEKGEVTPVSEDLMPCCTTAALDTGCQVADLVSSVSISEADKDRFEKLAIGETVLIQ